MGPGDLAGPLLVETLRDSRAGERAPSDWRAVGGGDNLPGGGERRDGDGLGFVHAAGDEVEDLVGAVSWNDDDGLAVTVGRDNPLKVTIANETRWKGEREYSHTVRRRPLG